MMSMVFRSRTGWAVRLTVLLLAALVASSGVAEAQRTLIRAGRVLDPASGEVSRDRTIVVEHGRVTAVSGEVRQLAGDSVVDLSNLTHRRPARLRHGRRRARSRAIRFRTSQRWSGCVS